tara:strand:- start:1834 stop:2748 length:915 start_codon:yes stop_codon:yes gene_type:complete
MNERKRELWIQAIKWPLYSVVIIPIVISAAYLLYQFNNFRVINFIGFNFASLLILFWENLTNDLFDSSTGIDRFKFHSVVNLIRNKKIISIIAYISLIIGLIIFYFISKSSNSNVFLLILGCCTFGYLYQGPPFRLGYIGLGEPLCWITFGPLTHAAILLALNSSNNYNSIPWKESLLLGSGTSLAITLVLFCSHFHQIKEDQKFGKKSPLVILGAKNSSKLIPWIIFLIYSFEFFTIIIGFLPILCLLYFISLPYAIKLIRILRNSYNSPQLIKNCKFIAIQFQALNGIGIILGLSFSFLLSL